MDKYIVHAREVAFMNMGGRDANVIRHRHCGATSALHKHNWFEGTNKVLVIFPLLFSFLFLSLPSSNRVWLSKRGFVPDGVSWDHAGFWEA